MTDHLFAYSHDPEETWGYLGQIRDWKFVKTMNHQNEPVKPHFFGVVVDVPTSRSLFFASRFVLHQTVATLEFLGNTKQILCGEGLVQELQKLGEPPGVWFQRFAVLVALSDTLVLSSCSEELQTDLGIGS